jgi:ERCC4-type nuclease
MYIVADYREGSSEVVHHLASLGVEVKVRSLDVADYIASERAGVERKTVMDLASSIADGRLFEQAEALVKAFQLPVLLVEGSLEELYSKRRFTPSQVQGALAYLVELGVHVAPSASPLDTAHFLLSLAKRERSRGGGLEPSPYRLRKARRRGGIREAQLRLVASIPGIGFKLAERLLQSFGSPRRLFKASPSELRRVPGMGEARVRGVIEVLDTSFKALEG